MVKFNCHFCHASVSPEIGLVDIGGLALCVRCYATRKVRANLPCVICKKPAAITTDPRLASLAMNQICPECEKKADLVGAYQRAYQRRDPCDLCGKQHLTHHHADVWGRNLCHDCYEKEGRPWIQLYSGDRGYPAFYHEPSIPAVVLPTVVGDVLWEHLSDCMVCKNLLVDLHLLIARFNLPAICEHCAGPKWWDHMNTHRDELNQQFHA